MRETPTSNRRERERKCFDTCMSFYRETLECHPLAAANLDVEHPNNKRLTWERLRWRIDIELAVAYALRHKLHLIKTWFKFVKSEQSVSMKEVQNLCDAISHIWKFRKLEPFRYFRSGRYVTRARDIESPLEVLDAQEVCDMQIVQETLAQETAMQETL